MNLFASAVADLRRGQRPVYDLTQSNPTKAGFDYSTLKVAAGPNGQPAAVYEPAAKGLLEARTAIVAYYAARGRVVSEDQIILTASTSEAYSFLFRLLADPGDSFAVAQPSYPLFSYLGALDNLAMRPFWWRYDHGWRLDMASLRSAVDHGIRGVILVHPNNPTGSYIQTDELAKIDEICAVSGVPLIVDEVFLDYRLADGEGTMGSCVGDTPILTFVLSGLSKVSGLPQAKLSWIVVCGPNAARQRALAGLELIADMYLSVASATQLGLGEMLRFASDIQPQIRQRIQTNHRSLQRCLDGLPIERLTVAGGWYAVIRLPGDRSDEEWSLGLLRERQVIFQPGYFYDFEADGILVCSLITPIAEFNEGITRLRSHVEEDGRQRAERKKGGKGKSRR